MRPSPELSISLIDSRQDLGARPVRLSRRVPRHYCGGEVSEIFAVFWRAGVMRDHAQMLRRETQREGCREFVDRLHLAIEPGVGSGSERIGPAQAGSQIIYVKAAQPLDGILKAMIFEVEPLADAQPRGKMFAGKLW